MSSVVVPGARVERLAGGFEFLEGPTCDGEGNLFFTDQPNDRILKWSVARQLSRGFCSQRAAPTACISTPGGT
jgi:gluconolactonase